MIQELFTWHFHFFRNCVSLGYILNRGHNLWQLWCYILIQTLPLSHQSSAPKCKWSVSGQIMTAWCFMMLWNIFFETSMHIWKYHLSFISLCSPLSLIIFTFFLLFYSYSLVKPSHCPLLLPPLLSAFSAYLPFPSTVPNLYFWTVEQNSYGKYDFLFQPEG